MANVVSREELNQVPEGTVYTSEIVTVSDKGQGTWLATTELGHTVYLNAPRPAGENLEYKVIFSKKSENNYCKPTNPAPRQGGSYRNTYSKGSALSSSSSSGYKHDLPPLSPGECTGILRLIVANYITPVEGKEHSLADILETKLGFEAANHQALLSGMLIACTKTNKYYEERK